MSRVLIAAAGLFGVTGVALGALGSHALKASLNAGQLAAFQTAVQYQLLHAIALLVLGIWYSVKPQKVTLVSGWAFIAGILLFSGSIYCLTLTTLRPGIITPIGGMFFMIGWLTLLVAAFKTPGKAQ